MVIVSQEPLQEVMHTMGRVVDLLCSRTLAALEKN